MLAKFYSEHSKITGMRRKLRHYSKEVKREAWRRVKNGETKSEVARDMGIPPRTVIEWTSAIRRRKIHPPKIRWKVRKMVKKGMSKADASRRTGVNYQTVVNWTRDIIRDRGNFGTRGKTLKLLPELVRNGYFFSDELNNVSHYRTLKKYLPVKRVVLSGKNNIYYLEGREKEAFKAFIKRFDIKIIDFHKLGDILRVLKISKRDKSLKSCIANS